MIRTYKKHTANRPNIIKYAMALSMSFSIATPVIADVVSGNNSGGSGMFLLIPAPAEVGNNSFQDDNVRAFNEIQNLTLTENLIMDRGAPDLPSNVLGPGSIVSSHYIIFDPASTDTTSGTVTFDETVVGVVTSAIRFNDTDDLLGNPATNYSIGNESLENSDTVTISGNTIEYDLLTNSPGDAIRVITSSNPQPGINVCADGTETLTGVITGGQALTFGGEFRQICAPIGPVGDNNFDSYNLYAFEEQQSVELVNDLFITDTTVISAGEFVSSFYIIWDPVPSNRVLATITFPDTIIGVISQQAELEASAFLGDASATYLNPSLLGLESGDTFVVNDNELSIDFSAGSPGDSIRVILGTASTNLSYTICEPQDQTLSGMVTGGTAATAGGVFAQLCDPIGPVGNNNQQANDLFVFEEAQNVVLADPIEVDEPDMTVIPAGTEISSYYVAFDPGPPRTITGTIDFNEPIIGIATSVDNLNPSDYLGNPTAEYLNPSLRGLEAGDTATFSGNQLTVGFGADNPGDYIRVFVAVPQPDSDGDGVTDNLDNCTNVANANQLDTNGDGFGNQCDPDLDNSGFVNFLDVSLFVDAFGSTGVQDADINGDGAVNFIDFAVIPSYFGLPPGPSALAGD
ncbi:MAG: thrombospondin type 3 repeat-containing protein [Gammaproteobacteria bacterium]